jgi:hypothetical protein
MKDRRALRGLLGGARVEIVVEDGLHRAVGAGLDLKRSQARGFDAFASEGLDQADDAEAGAKALLGMRPVLKDEIAKRCGRSADGGRLPPDALDGPVRKAAVARCTCLA